MGAPRMPRRWKRPAIRDGGWPRSRSGCWRAAAPAMPPQATATTARPWPEQLPRPRERRVREEEVMTTTSTATQRARPRTGRAWTILALACASQFMVILDAAIINVALPSVQRDLGF